MSRPAALLALLGIAAAAQPGARQAPAELQQLRAFLGRWTCDGKRFASPQAPEQPFQAGYEFTSALDGAWIATRYEERATPANPRPLSISEHWGYDAVRKSYVNRWVSNFGSGGAFYSPGWRGSDWTWETTEFPVADRAVPMRATFRVGTGSFVATPSMAGPDGNWVPFAQFTCRR